MDTSYPPSPLIYNAAGHSALLANLYQGVPAFLLCGGPSLKTHDLATLSQRGVLICAVNNAATICRPHLWLCVDGAHRFSDVLWRDPGILKFTPLHRLDDPLRSRSEDGELIEVELSPRVMPAVFGIQLDSNFAPARFLAEPSFTWGPEGRRTDSQGNAGVRSVFLVALKLLYVLGVRRVFLLGCDFRMRYGAENYAFAQDRSRGAVRSNNRSYRVLSTRLAALKPYFDEAGFSVANCTPHSGLTVFPHIPFEKAVEEALADFPKRIETAGMYDTPKRDRQNG